MAFEKGIGLYISDERIMLALLSHAGKVEGLFLHDLAPGLVSAGMIKRPKVFHSKMSSFLKENGLAKTKGHVTLVLPTSYIFIATFLVNAKMKRDERERAVLKKAQKQIPIPFKNAIVDIELGRADKEKQALSAFAVETELTKSLEDIVEQLNMPVVAIEEESLGTDRLIKELFDNKEQGEGARVIIDIGFRWLNMTLFNADGLAVLVRSTKLKESSGKNKSKKLSASQISMICGTIEETVGFFKKVEEGPVSVYISGVHGGSEELISSCKKCLKGHSVDRVSDILSMKGVSAADMQVFSSVIGAAQRASHPRKYNSTHNFKDSLSYVA